MAATRRASLWMTEQNAYSQFLNSQFSIHNVPVTLRPDLSIVIPTFNTGEMTLAACRAALAEAPEETEIIVVDDASSDDTHALLEAALPAVTVLRLETNRRFAGAANAGVAKARGRVILLLNSDARVEPGALTALVHAFAADGRLGIAGASLLNEDGSPQWSGGPLPTLAWMTVMAGGLARFLPRRVQRSRSDRSAGWVSGAAMAFRRETWASAGPLRETYRFYAQDLDFCARAARSGWHVRILEQMRVIHTGGATVRRWRDVHGLPHDPALLWPDLLAWGRQHHGPLWATAAWTLVLLAGTARVAVRRSQELLLRGPRLEASRAVTSAYARAIQQLFVKREQPRSEDVASVPLGDEPAARLPDRPPS